MRESDELIIGSAEAGELLGISVATVTRWVLKGKLLPLRKLHGHSGGYLFDARYIQRKATERLLDKLAKAG